MTFAIDFGTSNTVITRWNRATQAPEVVALPGFAQQLGSNPPLVPSLVYVKDAAAGTVSADRAAGARSRVGCEQ